MATVCGPAPCGRGSRVLEVGSGSGGPAVYLAAATGCRITGVDINERGIRNGERLAAMRRRRGSRDVPTCGRQSAAALPERDASAPSSRTTRSAISRIAWTCFATGTVSSSRADRILFTDALVVTGPITHEEIALRSSVGFYLFVPPGRTNGSSNRQGSGCLAVEDVTEEAAVHRRALARMPASGIVRRSSSGKEPPTSTVCSGSSRACGVFRRNAGCRGTRTSPRSPRDRARAHLARGIAVVHSFAAPDPTRLMCYDIGSRFAAISRLGRRSSVGRAADS